MNSDFIQFRFIHFSSYYSGGKILFLELSFLNFLEYKFKVEIRGRVLVGARFINENKWKWKLIKEFCQINSRKWFMIQKKKKNRHFKWNENEWVEYEKASLTYNPMALYVDQLTCCQFNVFTHIKKKKQQQHNLKKTTTQLN